MPTADGGEHSCKIFHRNYFGIKWKNHFFWEKKSLFVKLHSINLIYLKLIAVSFQKLYMGENYDQISETA